MKNRKTDQYTISNIQEYPHLWEESMQIYRDSFPQWEREDELSIFNNIQREHYVMFLLHNKEELAGFYILDINADLEYALFSFVAIKERQRGLGLGSRLTLHAIAYFQEEKKLHYFFTEAQERQATLYEKLGFLRLSLEYRVPSFNSEESIPMTLLLIQKRELQEQRLLAIIDDIFQRGYTLEASDPRLLAQLQRVKQQFHL